MLESTDNRCKVSVRLLNCMVLAKRVVFGNLIKMKRYFDENRFPTKLTWENVWRIYLDQCVTSDLKDDEKVGELISPANIPMFPYGFQLVPH